LAVIHPELKISGDRISMSDSGDLPSIEKHTRRDGRLPLPILPPGHPAALETYLGDLSQSGPSPGLPITLKLPE
jgi:hypothetical protein